MITPPVRAIMKSIQILVLAVVAGVAVYFVARTDDAPTPIKPVASRSASPAPAPTPPELPPQAAPTVMPAAALPVEEPTAAEELDIAPKLDGTWERFTIADTGEEFSRGRLQFKHDGAVLNVTGGNSDSAKAKVETGLRLILTFEPRENIARVFEGQLNPTLTEAIGQSWFTFNGEFYSMDDGGMKLIRLPEAQILQEQEAIDLRARRMSEVTKLAQALLDFAAAHHGSFPVSLNQLVPDFLDDPSILDNQPGRKITYLAAGQRGSTVSLPKEELLGLRKNPTAENLTELERRLREVWGGETPVYKPIAQIEFENPTLVLLATDRGDAQLPLSGEERPAQGVTQEELRNQEFMNLKLLGLALKMFQGEHNGYLPAGWFSLYPEYLADPYILHSPWVAEGNLSYDLITPARTERELIEFAAEIDPQNAPLVWDEMPSWSRSRLASDVPVAVSRELLPAMPEHQPARGVVFLDGHVESVTLSRWDLEITPYIQ
ncbi:MAG: hypothetical protein SGI88_02830 [Candidatus Hydrogenedentes bacterium]|nr:hypothetical protein [Candidatus Hydrogenedentota bacterium]